MKFPEASTESVASVVNDYVRELRTYERELRRRDRSEIVFLPSSGVFAEAILGLSNASEYINLRRFYNWQDSPIPNLAPAIQPVDVNQDHSQPVSDALAPTVPVSVLNQVSPMQYPFPRSLGAALQAVQNGTMFTDMSKTEQFAGILGNLADLAKTTAQLSGNLAGDAASNALDAAVDLGRQVATMAGAAMNTHVASPPRTPTKTGGVLEALDGIAADNGNNGHVSPIGQAQAGALGAPIPGLTQASLPPAQESPGSTTGLRYLIADDITAERRAFRPGASGNQMDLGRIALAGHSSGAGGALTVAGALRSFTGTILNLRDRRPLAFVGLSPQGPGGEGFFDTDFKRSTHSWIRVPRPVLLATGDGDNVCNPLDEPGSCFGDSPFIRRIAFERLTPGNKHLLYLHDADTFHSLFGLNTADCVAKNVAEARCEEIARWLRSMVLAFLDAHLRHEPLAIAWLATDNIVAASGGVAEHRRK